MIFPPEITQAEFGIGYGSFAATALFDQDTIKPGIPGDCENQIIRFPENILLESNAIEFKIFEVDCEGEDNTTLLFESGQVVYTPNLNDLSDDYKVNLNYSWIIGPPGDKRFCYFREGCASGTLIDRCFLVSMTVYSECGEDTAYGYFYFPHLGPQIPAYFYTSDTIICPGECIDFTSFSIFGKSWDWTFLGAEPAQAVTESPQNVCYDEPGQYDVNLIVDDCYGIDTILKENYIIVSGVEYVAEPVQADTLLLGENLPLAACAEGAGATYSWSPAAGLSCTDCPDPVAQPDQSTLYECTVSIGGCEETCLYDIFVGQPPVAFFMPDTDAVCVGDCMEFENLSEYAPAAVAWTFGTAETSDSAADFVSFCPPTAGDYLVTLTVTNTFGTDTYSQTVAAVETPAAPQSFTRSLSAGFGDTLSLAACTEGAVYQWAGTGLSCTDCAAPLLTVTTPQVITLTVGAAADCAVVCEYTVEVEVSQEIYVPTAFSPNGDSNNDTFRAYGEVIVIKELRIYDRWGGLRYAEKGADAAWDGSSDGEIMDTGMYVYVIEYENFVLEPGRVKIVSGGINLLR